MKHIKLIDVLRNNGIVIDTTSNKFNTVLTERKFNNTLKKIVGYEVTTKKDLNVEDLELFNCVIENDEIYITFHFKHKTCCLREW